MSLRERSEEPEPIRLAVEAGDLRAIAVETLRAYGAEILSLLRGLHRDTTQADEVFSRFTERLWTTLPTLRGQCSMRTWAYVIARNISFDMMRSEKRARRMVPLTDGQVHSMAELIRTQTSPFKQTDAKNGIARLRDELDEPDRILLVLRVDRNLAWKELAQVFVGPDAAAAEITRESARLRQRFQTVKARLRAAAKERGLIDDSD